MRKSGDDIEKLVETDQTREASGKIQRWYLEAKGHPKPSTREGLGHTSTLREDLYRQRLP